MKSITFVDKDSGIAHSQWIGPDDAVEANTPPGCVAIDGHFDMKSKRIDVKEQKVVDYTPPQFPVSIIRHNTAKAIIAEEEIKSLRAIRELLLDSTNVKALEKLQASDLAIASARTDIING